MPLQPTSLPTNITEKDLGHIGDSETVHSAINEITSTAGADRVGTADGQTVEEALAAKETAGAAAALADTLSEPGGAGMVGSTLPGGNVAAVLAALSAERIRSGNLTMILGDSIAKGDDPQDDPTQPPGSWFSRLCQASGQRMRYLRNAGKSSDTTAGMLARVETDVIAYDPDWCIVPLTTNDASVTPVATVKANYVGIIDALRAAGVRPICATMTPSDNTGKRSDTTLLNAWLAAWAASEGLPLFDLYDLLADPDDGTFTAGYTSDGTHLSEAGTELLATALVDHIPAAMHGYPVLTTAKNDAGNLLTNGVFVGDANADGTADGWTKSGGALVTASLVAGSGDVRGNWQRSVSTGSGGYFAQTIASGWSVGDRLALACRWATGGGVPVTVQIVTVGGTPITQRAISAHIETITDPGRIAYLECVIPAGTSSLEVRLTMLGAGTVDFAQATLRNLTAIA